MHGILSKRLLTCIALIPDNDGMQESAIQAVLFDLDGTLVDTIEDIRMAINIALEAENLENLTIEMTKQVVGRGLRNALIDACTLRLRDFSPSRINELYELMMRYYRKHHSDRSKSYEGILALLKTLNERNLPIGVFSNKEDGLTKEIVTRMFPSIRFVWVRGMREDYPRKPDKSGVLRFIDNVGIEMQHLLFVGDSEVDYQTAVNAGCPHILVTWGFRPKEELLTLRNAHLVDSVDELEDAIYGL